MIRGQRGIAYGLAVAPAVIGFVFVAVYGVDVPVADDWDVVGLLMKHHEQGLSFSDLFAQHNEHRILFPRLLALGLGGLTRFDTVAVMYASQIALLVTAGTLVGALRLTLARRVALLAPLVVALVFSLRQWEMMLLALNVGVAVAEAFAVLALFLLLLASRGIAPRLATVGAIAAGTIASFSMFHGLLVWPAGVVQLVAAGRRRLLALWAAAGVAASAAYLHGYRRPPGNPSLLTAVRHPIQAAEYFMTLLGAGLFGGRLAASVAGLVLLGAAAVAVAIVVRHAVIEEVAFWLGLLAFAGLVLVSITVGRVGLGVHEALSSRYAPYPLLAAVAILALLVRVAADGGARGAHVLAAAAAVVCCSVVVAADEGRRFGRFVRAERESDAFVLATFRTEPDRALQPIYPFLGTLRQLAPGLERLRYSIFASREAGRLPPELASLDRDPNVSMCRFDAVDGSAAAALASGGDLNGWCVDATTRRPAGGVYVLLDRNAYAAAYGQPRPDVAAYYKVDAYGSSGFRRAVQLPHLVRGTHTLSAIAISSDRKRAFRPTPPIVLKVR